MRRGGCPSRARSAVGPDTRGRRCRPRATKAHRNHRSGRRAGCLRVVADRLCQRKRELFDDKLNQIVINHVYTRKVSGTLRLRLAKYVCLLALLTLVAVMESTRWPCDRRSAQSRRRDDSLAKYHSVGLTKRLTESQADGAAQPRRRELHRKLLGVDTDVSSPSAAHSSPSRSAVATGGVRSPLSARAARAECLPRVAAPVCAMVLSLFTISRRVGRCARVAVPARSCAECQWCCPCYSPSSVGPRPLPVQRVRPERVRPQDHLLGRRVTRVARRAVH